MQVVKVIWNRVRTLRVLMLVQMPGLLELFLQLLLVLILVWVKTLVLLVHVWRDSCPEHSDHLSHVHQHGGASVLLLWGLFFFVIMVLIPEKSVWADGFESQDSHLLITAAAV